VRSRRLLRGAEVRSPPLSLCGEELLEAAELSFELQNEIRSWAFPSRFDPFGNFVFSIKAFEVYFLT
jgi:hypothetical protein